MNFMNEYDRSMPEQDPQIKYKAFLFDSCGLLRLIHADTLCEALEKLRNQLIEECDDVTAEITEARTSFKMFVGRKPDQLWQMIEDDADGISWFGKAKWKQILGNVDVIVPQRSKQAKRS